MKLPDHLVRQGMDAEARFRAWLDESRLPYLYADQTRESVPKHFRQSMKRPDFIVALPYVGTLAFDVKCKTSYDGDTFVFDVAEIRKLASFDSLFRITTYFACLPTDGSGKTLWLNVVQLYNRAAHLRRKSIDVSFAEGLPVDMDQPFQHALQNALFLDV